MDTCLFLYKYLLSSVYVLLTHMLHGHLLISIQVFLIVHTHAFSTCASWEPAFWCKCFWSSIHMLLVHVLHAFWYKCFWSSIHAFSTRALWALAFWYKCFWSSIHMLLVHVLHGHLLFGTNVFDCPYTCF